jgi:hypothetical protein
VPFGTKTRPWWDIDAHLMVREGSRVPLLRVEGVEIDDIGLILPTAPFHWQAHFENSGILQVRGFELEF